MSAKDKMWNGSGWYGFIGMISTSTQSILSGVYIEYHLICSCIQRFLFDSADETFHLTSTMDFGTVEEMLKMPDHLLYLS